MQPHRRQPTRLCRPWDSTVYSAGSFSHLRYHICSCKNVYLFICRICYSSIIVLAYSSVCLLLYWDFPLSHPSLSIWVASIGGGRNYCHTLYSVLHSVKMGDCIDCHLVVKALWYYQPPGAIVLYISLSMCLYLPLLPHGRHHYCCPFLFRCVCGMYRAAATSSLKLITAYCPLAVSYS